MGTELSKPLPHFEGKPVVGTAIKISGAVPMEDLEGAVIGIDDVVQVVGQFRCINVTHVVNGQGDLVRVQVLRPMFMVPSPIDPDDPSGDFIIKQPPAIVFGSVE